MRTTRYVINSGTVDRPQRTYDIVGVPVAQTRTRLTIRDRAGVMHSVATSDVICAHPHDASDVADSSLKLGVVRTPAEAISTATALLEWAEKHGGDVTWYVTDKTTWDELQPEQRRRSSVAEDARRLAAHLRVEADRLEGKL